ncbi:hypothetical protein [Actinoalloteichus spitiensis]|uniref:hypothetical protein n=1 Tax=Actinoalloteichus spitiensis TaxID=252394 RepID=UPI0012F6C05C|nr:hypothetical protein [Actinoalloteichus spitiensis]
MSTEQHALTLHLVAGGSPIVLAVDHSTSESLSGDLESLVRDGDTTSIDLADGGRMVVDFSTVATAHLSELRHSVTAYGQRARR